MLGDDSTWRLPRSCSSRPQPRPLAEIPATRSRDPREPPDAGRLKFTGHAYPLSTVERPGTALASGSCRHFRLRAERADYALCTTLGSGHPGAPRASLSAMGMGKSWGGGARGNLQGRSALTGVLRRRRSDRNRQRAIPAGGAEVPAWPPRLKQQLEARALSVVPRGGHTCLWPSVTFQKAKEVL